MGIQLLNCRLQSLESATLSEIRHIVTDIEYSCCVAVNILDDFLLVNKIEGGNLHLDKKDIKIHDLLSSVIEPFDIQARQKNISFCHKDEKHIDPSIFNKDIYIHVDVSKFSQVLRNLVSNALKFTPPGGQVDFYAFVTSKSEPTYSESNAAENIRKVTSKNSHGIFSNPTATANSTRVSYSTPDCTDFNRVLRIEVHDSGPGISEENQKRLFNEIVQFNAAELQNGGGSGLGLWISKAIMDHHGGLLGVNSTPDKGATFYVEIDIIDNEHLDFSTPNISGFSETAIDTAQTLRSRFLPQTPKIYASTPKSGSTSRNNFDARCTTINDIKIGRVLVVDDSAVNRKMISRLVCSYVGSVSQAADGMETVEAVRTSAVDNNPFDVIIMDVNMPVMNGIEATRLVKAGGYKGYISFLTGNAMPEERASFFAAGADEVIIKPCTLHNIMDMLVAAHNTSERKNGETCP
eukprot:CAMPEP_0185021538 /NCGR_PEP_ID=MMETSP1103-20130426/4227_1 /TAXON_ID=36769 /ORGANISM="Paraphysomonas bandaiensis, Strain Caron Lab Isolate" /LENGTH=463 /DNA_ID=CAMNT_0027553119 /DNA_START=928 /DNA_END=2319 /DNA_ORIENTATION=+